MNFYYKIARAYRFLQFFYLIAVTTFLHAQSGSPTATLETFLQKRLFNEICPVENNIIAKRVFLEYGAVYAADTKVRVPDKCIFSDEIEVQQFQKKLIVKNAVIRGVSIELQKAAMESLLEAIFEANAKGFRISPLDGSIAAKRSYSDTVRIWNSRFLPALNYWVNKGKISPAQAEAARNMERQAQVEKVLEWENNGWHFSTNFSKSIFSSTAPPGTSQHLSLLAFDVVEYEKAEVRDILNKYGWFQTIASDAPHFTFLGVSEQSLPARGLKLKKVGRHKYWIPNVTPGN